MKLFQYLLSLSLTLTLFMGTMSSSAIIFAQEENQSELVYIQEKTDPADQAIADAIIDLEGIADDEEALEAELDEITIFIDTIPEDTDELNDLQNAALVRIHHLRRILRKHRSNKSLQKRFRTAMKKLRKLRHLRGHIRTARRQARITGRAASIHFRKCGTTTNRQICILRVKNNFNATVIPKLKKIRERALGIHSSAPKFRTPEELLKRVRDLKGTILEPRTKIAPRTYQY